MLKRITSFIICAVLVLALSSCSRWFETPDDADSKLDTDVQNDTAEQKDTTDSVSDTADSEALTDEPGIPSIDSPALQELGENLQFFHTPNDDCVIVYNHENAWAFDYTLNKITRLTDFDAMYAVADVNGRAGEYFESCTMEVECEMVQDFEVRVMYTVKSDTADAFYKVYSYYTLDNNPLNDRGEVRGYYYESIEYPGSDEIVVINDVEDFNLLINSSEYDYKESYLYRAVKALVEVDVPELEAVMNLKEGTLSAWEGVVISDYSITNEKPLEPYIDKLILTVNITESSVEKYPVGTHSIYIYDGPGPVYVPASSEAYTPPLSKAEEFARLWAAYFGGWYPIAEQTMTDSGYAHLITDLYLNTVGNEKATLEGFEKFCNDTFGYTLERSGVTRESVEQHGGHGGADSLYEITSSVSSGNNYVIEVTFYADQLESVVARIHRIHITDNLDGSYKITLCEAVYDIEYDSYAWYT